MRNCSKDASYIMCKNNCIAMCFSKLVSKYQVWQLQKIPSCCSKSQSVFNQTQSRYIICELSNKNSFLISCQPQEI